MAQRQQPGFMDRTATLASWVLGGALFLTVGWFAVEPDDPLGPVSVCARHDALMMLIQAAALAGVVAGLATIIAGRRVADIGTFTATLGLAAVSVRGATAEYFLVRGADASQTSERALAGYFAVEGIGWFVVVIVAVGVSTLVMHWCFDRTDERDPNRADPSALTMPALAGYDVPRFSTRCFGISADRQTLSVNGIRHTLVATAVALAAMAVLSAGLSSRSIQHGQVCFVVAAAVFIGTYIAFRITPVRSALWPILSVVLLATVGYLWAVVRPRAAGFPPNIPSSHFLRVLPIQFISVGTAAALVSFWYVYVPFTATDRDRQRVIRTPTRGDKR